MNSLTYTVSATSPFSFYVRIPTWADSNSTITGLADETRRIVSPSSQGLQKVQIPDGEQVTFTVNLETQPRVEVRTNGTAAIYYGALLYSLAIEYSERELPPLNYRTQAVKEDILPNSTTHPRSHDHILLPKSAWNIAIDPSQIRVVHRNVSRLPSPIWALGASPVELRVAAVEIDWPVKLDTPADPPKNPKVTGKPFAARFVPYGSAKLHMAHLPVVSLPNVDLETEI